MIQIQLWSMKGFYMEQNNQNDYKPNSITVFTPTFNRKERLTRLKKSLDQQTDLDFVWLIVDDGSCDGTEEIVRDFMIGSAYPIHYYYQENQGKHVAHNYAVRKCKTELFYCVDSDDKLPPNSIRNIKQIWQSVDDKECVSGIIGLKAYFDYTIVGNRYPKNILRASLSELYSVHGKEGDTALIWRTEVINKYPFKVFKNENFLRENTAYDLIDMEYKLVVSNEVLYLVEYCDDGLSRNATILELKNPLGAAYYRLGEARKAKSIYKKIAYYSGYVFYSELGNNFLEAKKVVGKKFFLFKLLSKLMIIRYRMRGIQVDKSNDVDK